MVAVSYGAKTAARPAHLEKGPRGRAELEIDLYLAVAALRRRCTATKRICP